MPVSRRVVGLERRHHLDAREGVLRHQRLDRRQLLHPDPVGQDHDRNMGIAERQDEARHRDRGFEGEAHREQHGVARVGEELVADAVVRMDEDEEAEVGGLQKVFNVVDLL